MYSRHLKIGLLFCCFQLLLVAEDKNISPLKKWSDNIWSIEEPAKPAPQPTPKTTQKPQTTQSSPTLRRESRLFSLDEIDKETSTPELTEETADWDTAGQLPSTEEFKSDEADEQGPEPVVKKGLIPSTDKEVQPVPEKMGKPGEVANSFPPKSKDSERTLLVNFNDVSITEYIRFISRVSNKNFLFDEEDLKFNVSIMSEEPTTIDNMLAALLQILRVHGLEMIEEGNNLVIHRNPDVRSLARVITEDNAGDPSNTSELVTRVFRLNTLSPESVATMIRPMVSNTAIVEILLNSNHIIITDLANNISLINELLKSVDSPNSGLTFGQYVAQVAALDALVQLAEKIVMPIAKDQPIHFISNASSNSIFVVGSPYLVDKTLSILRHLDRAQGVTRMYDLNNLQFKEGEVKVGEGWELDENGNWFYRSTERGDLDGSWYLDADGNWIYVPKGQKVPPGLRRSDGPKGQWKQDGEGRWIYELSPGESPISIAPRVDIEPDLPVGHMERTKFLIHKLQYRPGNEIQTALQNIGTSLQQSGISNEDLINAIHSTQWIETSNSLVFTGSPKSLDKMAELVQEIDTPLRQVFIEMLILNTTVDDSLEYGVNFASQFRQKNAAGAQAFIDNSTSPVTESGETVSTGPTDASFLSGARGYNLGIVGSVLTKGGERFNNIAALVRAIRDKTESRIILNPKIIVEDGVQAEIFVGINTRFQTDSIANDFGTTITSNFEYQDVGTTLKVTPHLGHNDIVVLDIEQSQSAVLPVQTNDPQAREQQANAPTTSQSRTITRAHVPDRYFLILSGMMEDDDIEQRVHIPCLGGVPMIGGGFSNKIKTLKKRNTMIFIRPEIIDTEEQVRNVTRHQQKIWHYKDVTKDNWKYETEEALDFMNLTDPNPCDKNRTQY